jgi:hypothetical protein
MAWDADAEVRRRSGYQSWWEGQQALVRIRNPYGLARSLVAEDDDAARAGGAPPAPEPAFSRLANVPPARREGYLIGALLLGLGDSGMRSVAEVCGAVRSFLTPEWCAAEFLVAARMDPRAAAAWATDDARAGLGLRTVVEATLRRLERPGVLFVSSDDSEPQVIPEFNVPSRVLRRSVHLNNLWGALARDAAAALLANKERRTVGELQAAMRAALPAVPHRGR